MQLTAVFPTTEIGADAGAVRAWAQGVEALGFSRIMAYDHVLGAVHDGREPALRGPYTERDPFREPMVLFGYLAGVTERVELMPGVLVLPQRQVALVAKQAIEIDLLSTGPACSHVPIAHCRCGSAVRRRVRLLERPDAVRASRSGRRDRGSSPHAGA